MSRLLSITVLLIVLAELYQSAALRANFQVPNTHIRKCRCQVLANGKIRCPASYKKPMMLQDLHKCFCSKANQHKFPEIQAACNSLNFIVSTPL